MCPVFGPKRAVQKGLHGSITFPRILFSRSQRANARYGHHSGSCNGSEPRRGVPGVQVKAANKLTGLERTVQTDDSGDFTLAGLPVAGTYDITAAKPASPIRM